MVICKYFIQGNCRFGNKCRYEHTYSESGRHENYRDDRDYYDNNSSDSRSNRFSQYGNNRYNVLRENHNQSQPATTRRGDHDKENLQSVVSDIECWENGNQWLFSCYMPVKDGDNFPGFTDLSPEELRWKAYLAEIEGTGEKYKQELAELTTHVNNNRHKLRSLNPRFVDILRKLFSGVKLESSIIAENSLHTNLIGSVTTDNSSSAFSFKLTASSAAVPTQSGFSSNSSVFGNSSQGFSSSSGHFGNATNPPASLFGGNTVAATKSAFAQNEFISQQQNPIQQPQSSFFQSQEQQPFQSQNTQAMNIQSQQGGISTFSFAQAPVASSTGSMFGNVGTNEQKSAVQNFSFNPTQSNLFGGKSAPTRVNEESKKYSLPENLTDEDKMQFEAARFTMGMIPEKPPTKEFCR